MTITVGHRIPSVTLRHMTADGPAEITTAEIFGGKKVVLFGLPGAFTPTCSTKHLPGFVARANEIKAAAVDTVACLSVNDAFVMDAWSKDQAAAGKVLMLADGNADFTKAVGLEMDLTARGLGVRSRRYSMIVSDGVVEQLNVEENPREFGATSAEAILGQL